ncbi:MAG: carbohydrate ABC transporter permease [Candidatus Scatosoma sp.]
MKSIKNAKNRYRVSSIVFCTLALAVPVAHWLFMTLLQNGGTIFLAFKEFSMEKGDFVWVGFKNFAVMPRLLFSSTNEFPIALRNSLYFFFLNNFIILPLSVFCAILCFKRMPFGNVFRVIFFLPTIISPVVLAMVYSFAFDTSVGFIPKLLTSMGLENIIPVHGFLADEGTAMPLLLFYCLWIGIGGSIILVTGAISKIPDHLFELDRMYGLGLVKETFYVILPLIGSTVSILFLQGLGVILGFYMPSMLITGGAGKTTTIGLFTIQLVRGSQSNYGFASALSIVSVLIMSPIILICKFGVEKLFPAYEY